MVDNDKDLAVASLLAYINFDPDVVIDYKGCDLQTWFINDSNYHNKLIKEAEDGNYKAQQDLQLYNEIVSGESKYSSWKIIDYNNDNDNTGFCGICIDTGNREAIIAYRGTELTSDTIWKDVVDNDLGLCNNAMTPQQYAAAQYTTMIYNNYGDQFDSFDLAGHSLGGENAFAAALNTCQGMQEKIKRVVSFDGPGSSDEFLYANRDAIERMSEVMVHYKYTFIGYVLTQPPGIEDYTIETYETIPGTGEETPSFRHSICFIRFDENGMPIVTDDDKLLEMESFITGALDYTTRAKGVFVLFELIDMASLLGVSPLAFITLIACRIGFKIGDMIDINELNELANALSSQLVGRMQTFEINVKFQNIYVDYESMEDNYSKCISRVENVGSKLGFLNACFSKITINNICHEMNIEKKYTENLHNAAKNIYSYYSQAEKNIMAVN